jgi:methylenetetrahydrofolate reductase (NADPH)
MFVTEHLARAKGTLFSYEIIPPPRGKSAQEILDVVEQVRPFAPPFIDVTAHPAEAYYEENGDGTVRRRVRKKRPGTISICGIIQNRYGIDTVPHLLCRGFTREETEDAMIELAFLGINNVLAIRGDEPNYKKPVGSHHTVNSWAVELVTQMDGLRHGRYLEEMANSDPIAMCIGVGGYPEKHVEAPNVKTDVQHLKRKIEAGADYVVTQMCFDNEHYFRFVKQCRTAGIEVPIIPGIKVLTAPRQLTSLPRDFHVNFPETLADEVTASPDHAKEIGVRWATQQVAELVAAGVPCIHFYVMNDAKAVVEVIKRLG